MINQKTAKKLRHHIKQLSKTNQLYAEYQRGRMNLTCLLAPHCPRSVYQRIKRSGTAEQTVKALG